MPLAVYVTRYVPHYELKDAAYLIPVAGALGILAIVLSRRARRQHAVLLGRAGGAAAAQVGRVLGIVGICLACAGLVSLAVYGLLVYAGTRD